MIHFFTIKMLCILVTKILNSFFFFLDGNDDDDCVEKFLWKN